MARFVINGGKPLGGRFFVSGAKNEALKLAAFSILFENKILIRNTPRIDDVFSILKIIEELGGKYDFNGNDLSIDSRNIKSYKISRLSKKLRASIVLLGPILAKFGQVECPYPGGCVIGARSIETHLDAFRQLGANIVEAPDKIAIVLKKPLSKKVTLLEKSVTATENIIIYACGIDSPIEISNCAIEPEIMHLLKTAENSGVKVKKISERCFEITGSRRLDAKTFDVIPDRIEAGTFAIALIATGGEGVVAPYPARDLGAFTKVLKSCNAKIEIDGDTLKVYKSKSLKPFKIKTAPYPGFPTDLQSPMALIAAVANGISEINETMFENRLSYLNELKKIGLRVTFFGNQKAKVEGPATFKPTRIKSLDLRSGITLLIAALMTAGQTTIENAELIDRGYENVEKKFEKVGANIKRIL